MATLSHESTRFRVVPDVRSHGVFANPVRRGPVVLASDGTSQSGAVVVAAQLVAARLDVPLEVVSVLEPTPGYTTSVPEVVVPNDPTIDESRGEARETAVCDYFCRWSGGATPPRVHVRFGSVATEISRFAREVSATMVVMGSAPHRRFRRIASGDEPRAYCAPHRVRCSPCPPRSGSFPVSSWRPWISGRRACAERERRSSCSMTAARSS